MSTELPFRVALLVILALILPVSIHYRRRARQEPAQVRRGEEPMPLILARLPQTRRGVLIGETGIRPQDVRSGAGRAQIHFDVPNVLDLSKQIGDA